MDQWKENFIQLLSDGGYHTSIRKAGVFRFPSSYRFETHAHREYEINYINTGACIMEVEGSYVPLKAGECIVIGPDKSHCFMVDMQKACRITQLELVICCPQGKLEGMVFPGFLEPYHKLRECEQLVPLLERIGYYFRAGEREKTGEMQLDLMLFQLYALLSEEMDKNRQNADLKEANRARKVIRHIEENLDAELNLEQLSRQYGVSSRCVRKYFERQMGIGANEYITMLRIGKAKRLLWNQDYSVTDVAFLSGFSSSQYFCRVFHKHLGVAPAEYRKRCQMEPEEP